VQAGVAEPNETLAMFYQAREIIAWARHPGSFQGEGSTRERVDGETEDEARQRDA
jgi:hypothetical protein